MTGLAIVRWELGRRFAMGIEPQKEPGKQAPQPDVQPGNTPREIPQDKDIPQKETPPMQLAPGRGGNWWC